MGHTVFTATLKKKPQKTNYKVFLAFYFYVKVEFMLFRPSWAPSSTRVDTWATLQSFWPELIPPLPLAGCLYLSDLASLSLYLHLYNCSNLMKQVFFECFLHARHCSVIHSTFLEFLHILNIFSSFKEHPQLTAQDLKAGGVA
jgi:hypothetical protein